MQGPRREGQTEIALMLCRLKGGGGGQKLPILLSTKTIKRGGRVSKIGNFETT